MTWARWLVSVWLACSVGTGAWAQNVQHFRPAPGTWNAFGVETARTANALELVPALHVNHGFDPLVERDADGEAVEVLIGHLTTFDSTLVLGLTDRFELSAAVPVHLAYGDGLEAIGGEGMALGDARVVPKLRLVGAGHDDGNDGDEGFGLAISLVTTVGTGADARFLGEGQTTVEPRAAASFFGGGWGLAANLGFRARPESGRLHAMEVGHEITYGLAYLLRVSRDTWVLGEAWGLLPAAEIDDRGHPLEAVFGVRHRTSAGAVLDAGLGSGVLPEYGAPAVRLFVGVAFDRHRQRIRPKAPPIEPEPPSDRDGDGLLDADDACPDAPEDADGVEDDDGCPDPDVAPPPPVAAPAPLPPPAPRVRVAGDRIELLEKVFFENNRAVLRAVSYSLLDEVAAVLLRNQKLGRVRVCGHTDSQGRAVYNRRLSERRAQAVRMYLIGKGVDAVRLESAGYGEARPIDTNRTVEGRRMNRRVEFTILGGDL